MDSGGPLMYLHEDRGGPLMYLHGSDGPLTYLHGDSDDQLMYLDSSCLFIYISTLVSDVCKPIHERGMHFVCDTQGIMKRKMYY